MDYKIWLILILLFSIVILLFFLKRVKSFGLGSAKFFKRKLIRFATPHRVELILLFLYAVFFLWWDVLQNKVLDKGVDYSVTWIPGLTSSALDLAIIMLILFHVMLMALFLMSLKSKATNRTYDVIMGTIALFGVAIVLAGFVNSIYSDHIRFLFFDMSSVTFYHVGIAIEMTYGLYLGITK